MRGKGLSVFLDTEVVDRLKINPQNHFLKKIINFKNKGKLSLITMNINCSEIFQHIENEIESFTEKINKIINDTPNFLYKTVTKHDICLEINAKREIIADDLKLQFEKFIKDNFEILDCVVLQT